MDCPRDWRDAEVAFPKDWEKAHKAYDRYLDCLLSVVMTREEKEDLAFQCCEGMTHMQVVLFNCMKRNETIDLLSTIRHRYGGKDDKKHGGRS